MDRRTVFLLVAAVAFVIFGVDAHDQHCRTKTIHAKQTTTLHHPPHCKTSTIHVTTATTKTYPVILQSTGTVVDTTDIFTTSTSTTTTTTEIPTTATTTEIITQFVDTTDTVTVTDFTSTVTTTTTTETTTTTTTLHPARRGLSPTDDDTPDSFSPHLEIRNDHPQKCHVIDLPQRRWKKKPKFCKKAILCQPAVFLPCTTLQTSVIVVSIPVTSVVVTETTSTFTGTLTIAANETDVVNDTITVVPTETITTDILTTLTTDFVTVTVINETYTSIITATATSISSTCDFSCPSIAGWYSLGGSATDGVLVCVYAPLESQSDPIFCNYFLPDNLLVDGPSDTCPSQALSCA